MDCSVLSFSLHQRVAGSGSNTAVIVTVACHLYVTLVTPGRAPGVLYQPVVFAFLRCSITDRQHTVIELFRIALRFVVHTLRVELERFVRCIDSDRYRAHGGNRLHQCLFITLRNVNEALVRGTDGLRVVMALVVDRFVRVRLLRIDTLVVLNVLEGKVHHATVATIVTVFLGTVDEILLGKRH
uniref:Uncharacterized protein n=1 Tax=Anopheles culicifacies TaxID=139723 RepID=A0A182MHF3_9DIPT